MNVPALSERTLRRDIEKGVFSTGSEIQVPLLLCCSTVVNICACRVKSTADSNPAAWWWVKADGVDVVKGLWVSTRGEWSGDADLNDGNLAAMYGEYKQRLAKASKLGIDDQQQVTETDLNLVLHDLRSDLDFLHSGMLIKMSNVVMAGNIAELQRVSMVYEEKLRLGKS